VTVQDDCSRISAIRFIVGSLVISRGFILAFILVFILAFIVRCFSCSISTVQIFVLVLTIILFVLTIIVLENTAPGHSCRSTAKEQSWLLDNLHNAHACTQSMMMGVGISVVLMAPGV
jgi:hypothetical protein